MDAGTAKSDTREQALLESARKGDENAFESIVEMRRSELQAHCYRMLGSTHDAEDALQEALVRAWRGLPRFEGRSSLRSWLYKIATNTCLDAIGRRPKRVLPIDYAPASDPHEGPGDPIVESVWVEPFPDELIGVEDGYAGPEASYEQREAVELAFIAALQHLPATQRAVLVLREVLGFSAKETSEHLDTTTASVNSALQRARATLDEKLPDQTQQATLRALGDEKVAAIVDRYLKAWETNDVDTVVEILAEDATFTMPPLASWFHGPGIRTFLELSPMSGDWRWKAVPVQSNGQPALAFYAWNEGEEAYRRFALNVLTFRGERIVDVTAFIARTPPAPDREVILRLPDHEADAKAMDAAFDRFGLPETIH